ncbi:MAG: hypothetical protein IK085_07175, partial [Clostridia bacterium]|nr:hypothetical protein [Clostridia bacterium]
EHAAVNRGVTGSSPVWGAIEADNRNMVVCFFFCFRYMLQPFKFMVEKARAAVANLYCNKFEFCLL